MAGPVLVTGATGLIGSNVCRLLRECGRPVRALVRPGSESAPLAALGVELVSGDITVAADVARAADGVGAVVNSAALLGGAVQDRAASDATNHLGSVHCYDAAAHAGARMVELATTTFLRHDAPLTEPVAVLDEVPDDPYTVSKAAAFRDGLARVDAGEDVVFVIPGGTFGPAPVPGRAMGATSYNRLVRAAVRGRVREQLTFPVPWVRAEDVAAAVVAAIERGRAGETYLAFGLEDAVSTAAFLTVACEVAGVPHRVADVSVEPGDAAAVERYGETLVALAQRRWPVPWFDNSHTREQLGYAPVPLRDALAETVDWLRAIGQLD